MKINGFTGNLEFQLYMRFYEDLGLLNPINPLVGLYMFRVLPQDHYMKIHNIGLRKVVIEATDNAHNAYALAFRLGCDGLSRSEFPNT